MELTTLTISQIRDCLASGRASAEELVAAYLERIRQSDPDIRAYLTLCPDRAFAQAQEIDRKIARKETVGPLAGVPMAVKDVILTRGIRTTAGSRILANYIAPYDATVVQRLESAGACVLGKTNCDEFA